jgi:hypothetical protein
MTQNMSPHHILKNITPKEAFTGVKPRLKNSGYSGAQCIFHVPKEKNSKIDLSGRKDTFMG